MSQRERLQISTHDTWPPEAAAVVDLGLDTHNNTAAPLQDVQALDCIAQAADGSVRGRLERLRHELATAH